MFCHFVVIIFHNRPSFCLSPSILRFGDVRVCHLVMDKALNRPKGTAFVEMTTTEAVEAALKAAAAPGSGVYDVSCGYE